MAKKTREEQQRLVANPLHVSLTHLWNVTKFPPPHCYFFLFSPELQQQQQHYTFAPTNHRNLCVCVCHLMIFIERDEMCNKQNVSFFHINIFVFQLSLYNQQKIYPTCNKDVETTHPTPQSLFLHTQITSQEKYIF